MNAVITTHKLDFECCRWPLNPEFMLYRIGTMEGQYFIEGNTINILSFLNTKPNNGHLEDVFEWFEYSCKTHGLKLRILEVMNARFKEHLIAKRGFVDIGKDNLEKTF